MKKGAIPPAVFICGGAMLVNPTAVTAAIGSDADSATAGTSTFIWRGGGGNWSNSDNWNPPTLPDVNGHWDEVLIDADNPINSVVSLNINISLSHLDIQDGDGIVILNGQTLQLDDVSGPALLSSNGSISFVTTSSPAEILIASIEPARFEGAGTIALFNTNSRIVADQAGRTLVNGEGHAITGAGTLGGGTLGITNEGVITANRPFLTMDVDAGNDLINSGTIEAINNARLTLAGIIDNSGGVLRATESSIVTLNDAHISGGSIRTETGGIIRAQSGESAWSNLTHDGTFELLSADLRFSGTIVNDGLVRIVGDDSFAEPVGDATILIDGADGDVVLAGAGEIRLFDNELTSAPGSPPATLFNGVDHRITGGGILTLNALPFVNDGQILADDDAEVMVLNLPNGGQTMVNNGLIRASGFAGVLAYDGKFTNNGTIEITSSSQLIFASGAVVTNGAGGTLAGGTWIISADVGLAEIIFPGVDFIINNADVSLIGPGAQFPNFEFVVINSGRIALLDGRTYTTDVWFINDGELEIGSNSRMDVTNYYVQHSSGTLKLELSDGEDGRSSAVVEAEGNLTLAGTLDLSFTESTTLLPGQEYVLLTGASVSGQFGTVIAPPDVAVVYEANRVVATIIEATCPGDFNDDGVVGTPDLFELTANWGACPAEGPCPWDLDGDGVVASTDLLLLGQFWGPCN